MEKLKNMPNFPRMGRNNTKFKFGKGAPLGSSLQRVLYLVGRLWQNSTSKVILAARQLRYLVSHIWRQPNNVKESVLQ